jgi:hypothetical protein
MFGCDVKPASFVQTFFSGGPVQAVSFVVPLS